MSSFMILCLTILAYVSFVNAVPLIPRDVVSPPITIPTSKTVWNCGEKQMVTWDISNLPPTITNPIGMVVLGFSANDSENLMLDSPLAKGFNLTDAKVEITVPSVPTRDDYIIVLFGDSGNASPEFTINAVSPPEAPSSSPPVGLISVSPVPPITTASAGSTIPALTTVTTPATHSPTSISMPTMTSTLPSSATSSSATSPFATSPSATTPSATSSTAPSPVGSSNAAQVYGLDLSVAYSGAALILAFLTMF